MFESLQIQGFRAFEDLQLHGLGRVNLIVGTNNIGKTTVLEAIKIRCAGAAAIWEIRKLLDSREEIERQLSDTTEEEPHLPLSLRRVFYFDSNASAEPASPSLSIGGINDPESTLTLKIGWAREIKDETGVVTRQLVDDFSVSADQDVSEAVILSFGDKFRRIYTPERILRRIPLRSSLVSDTQIGLINCHYLPAMGFSREQTGELWDKVVLTDLELDVLSALKIIAPEIERISLVESEARRGRVALVRRSGALIPESLKSLGDGMNRIFQIALALANSKEGILLIDEVENGIHYSVQQELWSFIFAVASRLGSQVFASTHSWDCIESFQKAASSHPAIGALIRLFQHEEKIKANTFDEHRLEILTRESIEVR
jgi:hypothetical protein